MNLPNQFDTTLVQKYIDEGLVKVNKHPSADLYIYNYTQTAQFSGVLKTCPTLRALRGYIADGAGNYVARGFAKFFNLGEQPEVDAEYVGRHFVVEEKVDGSCGILYYDGTDWAIATRGSFTSEQAVEGTKILREKYRSWIDNLPKGDVLAVTHVFEIVYPENRIVVDYEGKRDLVLIGKIMKDGHAFTLNNPTWPGPVRETYGTWKHANVIKDGLGPEHEGKEGFVLVYDDGHRVKVKLDEYLRLHRIVTNASERSVWEALRTKQFDSLLDNVPDEFYQWVKEVKSRLEDDFVRRYDAAVLLHTAAPKGSRKEYAQYVTGANKELAAVAFRLYDGKPDQAADLVWRSIEPSGACKGPFAARAAADG
jgi:RNA ligase